jgi:hypothetical protein
MPWDKAHPPLWVAQFVLIQWIKVIVLIFIVSDISISLAGYYTEDRQWLEKREKSGNLPRKRILLSLQNSITTPADWSSMVVLRFLSELASYTPTY